MCLDCNPGDLCAQLWMKLFWSLAPTFPEARKLTDVMHMMDKVGLILFNHWLINKSSTFQGVRCDTKITLASGQITAVFQTLLICSWVLWRFEDYICSILSQGSALCQQKARKSRRIRQVTVPRELMNSHGNVVTATCSCSPSSPVPAVPVDPGGMCWFHSALMVKYIF